MAQSGGSRFRRKVLVLVGQNSKTGSVQKTKHQKPKAKREEKRVGERAKRQNIKCARFCYS